MTSLASDDGHRRRGAILSQQTTNVKQKEVRIESGRTFFSKLFWENGKAKGDLEMNDE